MKKGMLMFMMLVAAFGIFTSCSENESKGRVKIYMTDAPTDASNVDAVIMSVTKIELKGNGGWKTVKEFSTPLSIDILDYSEGNSFFVTEETLDADTYSEARLILNASVMGNAPKANPDCYIRYADGTKKELFVPSGDQSGFKVKGTFTLPPDGTVAVTLDFDARKSIVSAGASGKFLLKPTVRLVTNDQAALIDGNFAEYNAYSKIIVFAYEKGTYDVSEAATPAEGEVRFKNSISSTDVNADGSFKLAFMNPGEYDLVFVAHNSNGEYVDVLGGYKNTTVTAGARIDLNISLSMLLDL